MAGPRPDPCRPLENGLGTQRAIQATLFEERDEAAQESLVRTHRKTERPAEGEI